MVKMLGVILIFFLAGSAELLPVPRNKLNRINWIQNTVGLLADTVGCLMASHDTDGHNSISLLSCKLAYKRYA